MRRALLATALSLTLGACSGQDVFELSVGTCFDNAPSRDGTLVEVPLVDCDQPHDNEVFANWELTRSVWPGAEAAEQLARQGCLERFEDWAGILLADSSLDVSVLYPTEASWFERDDRRVTCVVSSASREKLIGSARSG